MYFKIQSFLTTIYSFYSYSSRLRIFLSHFRCLRMILIKEARPTRKNLTRDCSSMSILFIYAEKLLPHSRINCQIMSVCYFYALSILILSNLPTINL